MTKKDLKCVVCGGTIVFNEESEAYICSECNANHSSDIFKVQPKDKKKDDRKGGLQLRRMRIVIALLGTLYLIWLIYRILY